MMMNCSFSQCKATRDGGLISRGGGRGEGSLNSQPVSAYSHDPSQESFQEWAMGTSRKVAESSGWRWGRGAYNQKGFSVTRLMGL